MSAPTVTTERTPLYDEHLQLHAQMTTFGGWSMPLVYTSIRDEHLAVRRAVGLFDLSHMGELRVDGPGALALVQRVVTRDVGRLAPGRAHYALLCDERGGIIDDLLVYAEADGYLLVVNAANQDRDFGWMRVHAGRDAEVHNVGRDTALIGVQGPLAVDLVQEAADRDVRSLRHYAFVDGRLDGSACRYSRTGYTGEDGFEIFCANPDAPAIWRWFLEHGHARGLRPAGLGARDTLRLEAGMRLYGNDMDDETNPLEAGLGWTVSFEKDFIGKAAIVEARTRGLRRILVGLQMHDRSIPRHGYRVLHEGKPVGSVGSGNVSFSLGYNIALAFVPPALADPGTQVAVEVRGVAAPAGVVDLPFYRRPI